MIIYVKFRGGSVDRFDLSETTESEIRRENGDFVRIFENEYRELLAEEIQSDMEIGRRSGESGEAWEHYHVVRCEYDD